MLDAGKKRCSYSAGACAACRSSSIYKIDRIPRQSSIKHPVSSILGDYWCSVFIQIIWPNCKRNDEIWTWLICYGFGRLKRFIGIGSLSYQIVSVRVNYNFGISAEGHKCFPSDRMFPSLKICNFKTSSNVVYLVINQVEGFRVQCSGLKKTDRSYQRDHAFVWS